MKFYYKKLVNNDQAGIYINYFNSPNWVLDKWLVGGIHLRLLRSVMLVNINDDIWVVEKDPES